MCLDKKTPRLFNVAVCNNVHYTQNTEYVTFNYDNDFVPGEVWWNSRYNNSGNNDTHNLLYCWGLF